MNRSFMTKWPVRMGEISGKPTYFVEKIWESLDNDLPSDNILSDDVSNEWHDDGGFLNKLGIPYQYDQELYPKIHTMRVNKSKQLKKGGYFNPTIWSGKPYNSTPLKFAPPLLIMDTQEIVFEYSKSNPPVVRVWIGGNMFFEELPPNKRTEIDLSECNLIERMAVCDGFDTLFDFFKWFSKDWKGDIIHWTDFKY